MKRIILCLFSVAVLLLSGCSSVEESTGEVYAERSVTSAGTPISEETSYKYIDRISTPDSSCFSEIGYDANSGTLLVTFRDSDVSYIYDEVPQRVWNALVDADSMGTYYNKNIKGNYDSSRLE